MAAHRVYPRRHRRRRSHNRRRNRRRNPLFSLAPRHHRRNRRRYRRNPRHSFREIGIMRFVEGGAWATGGAIFTRALPGLVLSSYNNGLAGYALNFGSAILASFLGGFISSDAALFAGIGGISATFLRMIQDYGGGNIPGMQGDIDHLGYFVESGFPVPVASDWSQLVPSNPRLSYSVGAAPAALPVAAGKTAVPAAAAMSPAANPGVGRWSGRYSS